MALSHLRFFDKRGNNISPTLDNGVFKFNMFFEQVSTGLFASEHLFILEEIYHEHEGTAGNNSTRNLYTPLIIRIMEFINGWGSTVKKEQLNRFFPTLRLETDYVYDFLKKNTRYIISTFDGTEVVYSLTADGVAYLNDYKDKEQQTWLDNERKLPELTRPRSNYDINKSEDAFLFFRWRVPKTYDRNIFVYYIDQSDSAVYYDAERASTLASEKRMPAIVPIYSEDIEPDGYNNPDWKKWFLPYRFDDGTNDDWIKKDKDGNPDMRSNRLINSQTDLNQKPFQLNFAMNSDEEGQYVRILDLFMIRTTIDPTTNKPVSNIYQIAEITFFGEVVGEDERFKLLLENFGRKVDENDAYIFRDAETEEDLPDYITINEKRKELLLVGEEIYNYMGSYKAFVNAMKFFGYQDLRLKEYFVNVLLSNVTTKQIYYTAVDIPLDLKVDFEFDDNKDFNDMIFGGLINNKVYMKSSRFGLFYDLNKVTNEIDEYGFPIIEDIFAYTNEEILIKLYGLKTVLQKYFLPHHARIIDITGEGIYFAKYKINTWSDQNPIIALKYDTNPEFVASPLSGYIKPLDHLLNLFRKSVSEINDVSTIGVDDIISTVINNALSDYIKSSSTDFPFDKEVTFEIIQKFYPDYWSLKRAVYNFLRNGDCPISYTNYAESSPDPIFIEKTLVLGPTGSIPQYEDVPIVNFDDFKYQLNRSLEHSIKMMGLPVLLKLEPYPITWDDMPVRYNMLENELGPVDINAQELYNIESLEVEKYDWTVLSEEDKNTLRRLLWSGSRLFSWDNVGYFGSQWMQWYIRHEDGSYCYKVEGLVSDIKNILMFLPQLGLYDVTLSMRDYGNFPRITGKKDYIEVKKQNPEFVAIGRYINKYTDWDSFGDIVFDKFTGIWNYNSYCDLETTWDDSKVTWDDMEYPTYQSQYFTKEIETTSIVDYNDNTIILNGIDFWQNHRDYSEQKWRDVLVVERPSEDVPTNNYVTINSLGNKLITLNGIHDIPAGEKINLYKYILTDSMIIANEPRGRIDIVTDFIDSVDIDETLKLVHGSDLEKEPYRILDVDVDYSTSLVHVTVEDDGSLYDISHNKIELRGDDYIFKVVSCIPDYDNNVTNITVIDKNGNIRDIINKGISNYRAEWGIYSGRYVFNIIDVTTDVNNTIVRIEPSDDICNITSTFVAMWAKDYDFDWAERHNNSTSYNWDNFDNITMDDTSNQTWNMLEYHGKPITGFKIIDIKRSGWIKLNDEVFSFNIPNTVEPNATWSYLKNLLNTSEQVNIQSFDYYVIDNNYIQAISKISGNNSLMTIETSGNVTAQLETYPKNNFEVWDKSFYSGYNNPAMWQYLKQGKLSGTDWALNGAFNMSDTFISYKDMILPIFTTAFIVFSTPDDISFGNKYEWELWEDKTNKLLSKSNYRYLVWNFVDYGIYTVKLTLIDDNNNKRTFEKKGWIYIR